MLAARLALAAFMFLATTPTAHPVGTATPARTSTPTSHAPTPTSTLAPAATATATPPAATSTPALTSTATATPPPTTSAPTATPRPADVLASQVIGYSAEGRPLTVYQLGAGTRSVLVVGGIDGGTEANTTALVDELLARLPDAPDLLEAGFTLQLLPAINPDGVAAGERMLADGVDANRNWPTDDWSPDTYVAGPTLVVGGGGPNPLSEPETRTLAAFVGQTRPSLIVSYHSAAALVMAGPAARALGLDRLYAATTGYAWGDWTAYPVTGDFAQWTEDQGIPTVEVELPDHTTTDFDVNFDAFRALIDGLASELDPATVGQ